MRQPLHYVAQSCIRLLAANLGGLGQTINPDTGRSAFRRTTEQPALANDDERLYRTLGQVFVERQVIRLDMAF